MCMTQKLIECISLSKQYLANNQIITALNDISLHVEKNEVVLLKGRSGAGKSTLLYLMSGLIKPTDGKVIIDGICITDLSENALSNLLLNRFGFIFQNFNLLPTYTVYENIEIALIPKGLNRDSIRESIMPMLAKFNLQDKSELLPSALSIGQQQIVAIIRTLVKKPSIVFADEPTGSVDDITAEEIIDHLLDLKKEQEMTIVMATHGNIPEKVADRIYMIENGRIKE
jgi:putative ABC transport system ATP-binding protein